jgi:hypothetical protein
MMTTTTMPCIHSFMKLKFKHWLSTIPPLSTNQTIVCHLNSLNIKRNHNIWCWKSKYWLGTGTKMWLG